MWHLCALEMSIEPVKRGFGSIPRKIIHAPALLLLVSCLNLIIHYRMRVGAQKGSKTSLSPHLRAFSHGEYILVLHQESNCMLNNQGLHFCKWGYPKAKRFCTNCWLTEIQSNNFTSPKVSWWIFHQFGQFGQFGVV